MLLTYGHGTDSSERTVATLLGADVASLVDIRTAPGSRRNPQFARYALSEWLPEAGIWYRWEKRLGGFRRPSPDNPDVAWHEDMFRGYAEHMRSAGFLNAIDGVLAEAAGRQVAVMCSESLWWRCHRRLVADFVSAARGVEVRHLMHDGRTQEHRPSPASGCAPTACWSTTAARPRCCDAARLSSRAAAESAGRPGRRRRQRRRRRPGIPRRRPRRAGGAPPS